MTRTDHIPESALERITAALARWVYAETKRDFYLWRVPATAGAFPVFQLIEDVYSWNGLGADVDEVVLAAGAIDDVHTVALRIVDRFNRGVEL